jgi:hypothetical protein
MFNVQSRPQIATTAYLEPFDISLYATEEGLRSLQTRFASYLRGVSHPIRFFAIQTPADLSERIYYVGQKARRTGDAERRAVLHEYRRFYELLQARAHYQRSLCGMTFWADASENPHSLTQAAGAGFEVHADMLESPPPILAGNYRLGAPDATCKYWHLTARRQGRTQLCLLAHQLRFCPQRLEFLPAHGRTLANRVSHRRLRGCPQNLPP